MQICLNLLFYLKVIFKRHKRLNQLLATGETFLKTSDYPFVYSFSTIIIGLIGANVATNALIVLGITGFFGTLLTITDPVGNIIKKDMEKKFGKSRSSTEKGSTLTERDYDLSAIKTRAIGIEVDKLVSIVYFTIVTLLFALAMTNYTFAEKFVISGNDKEPICNVKCIQISGTVISTCVAFYMNFYTGRKWASELYNKIKISGVYQLAIDSEYSMTTTVENMGRSIEQADWTIAKKWGEKIKEEIKYKKDKKEIIIKAVENIYQPLYAESVKIDSNCRGILENRHYYTIPVEGWSKITQKSEHVIIEEIDFRTRIDVFYQSIVKYNDLVVNCNKKLEKIINDRLSETYGRKVVSIRYWVKGVDFPNQLDLIGCAFFDLHPARLFTDAVPFQLDIGYSEVEGTSKTHTTNDVKDLQMFDDAWNNIETDVKSEKDFSKLKELFDWIRVENQNLMVKYSEKIAMQLKV